MTATLERDRVRRDCACPVANHEHGTLAGYCIDACRCTACTAASTRNQKVRRLMIDRGQWRPYAPIIGTRRRVLALALQGWPLTFVAARAGVEVTGLRLALRQNERIKASTADAISALYDELWNTPAPATTGGQRVSVARARTWARQNGAAPALAWDDDTIDDPNAQPQHDAPEPSGRLQPCGTEAAHRRHLRKNEPVDPACRRAYLQACADRAQRRRAWVEQTLAEARAQLQEAS